MNRTQGRSLFTWENYQTTLGSHNNWIVPFSVWIQPCFLSCMGFCREPFDDLSQQCSVANFQNRGSFTSNVSSFTNSIKSTRSGSLNCFLLILNTHLTHLSLVWPGSLDSNMHVASGVSTCFHCADCAVLLHFYKL